ncbi:MAG: hypothetical protein WAQ28_03515 [Bacteroidia bacterium]
MRRKQRFRGQTAAEWTAENPILGKHEPGFESDTLKVKIGDGTSAWADLLYNTDVVFDHIYMRSQGAEGHRWKITIGDDGMPSFPGEDLGV